MGIIDTIRQVFTAGTDPDNEPHGTPEDSFLGTQLAATGIVPPVLTGAPHDASDHEFRQPVEVEREQDPEARRDNIVVRKD